MVCHHFGPIIKNKILIVYFIKCIVFINSTICYLYFYILAEVVFVIFVRIGRIALNGF